MKVIKFKMVLYDKPRKAKKWTIKNFEGCFFKGPKNLSKNVDK